MEDWSNNACLGYAIRAAKALKMTEKQIKDLVNEMKYCFDMRTIEEAKEEYCKSPY